MFSLSVAYGCFYGSTAASYRYWEDWWLMFCRMPTSWSLSRTKLIALHRFITYITATMSWGFFCKTGAEMDWSAAEDFFTDSQGMKILLSESQSTLIPGSCILAVSWTIRSLIFTQINELCYALINLLHEGKSIFLWLLRS